MCLCVMFVYVLCVCICLCMCCVCICVSCMFVYETHTWSFGGYVRLEAAPALFYFSIDTKRRLQPLSSECQLWRAITGSARMHNNNNYLCV